MKIIHPTETLQIRSRDALLQSTMRPENLPFSIAAEYPIVLSASECSYCVVENDRVIAHANLWPRTLIHPHQSVAVGLVGNVATDSAWQGKGIMKKLFSHMSEMAASQGIEALILWSDLSKFYQKLGFAALGKERRFYFRRDHLKKKFKPLSGLMAMEAADITSQVAHDMLATRFATRATLQRLPAEFIDLLRIPATLPLVYQPSDAIEGYLVCGRGYDLMSVVHEWGMPSPKALLQGLLSVAELCDYENLTLLAPHHLPSPWDHELANAADEQEVVSMAMGKFLTESPRFAR